MRSLTFALRIVTTITAASLAACSAPPSDGASSAASRAEIHRKKLDVPGSPSNVAIAPLVVENSAGGGSDDQHYLVEEISNQEMVVLDLVNPKPGKQPDAVMSVANVREGEGQALSMEDGEVKDRTSVVLWPDNYNIDVKSSGPATIFRLEARRVTPSSLGWPAQGASQTESVLARGTVKKKDERHYYLTTGTEAQWLISKGANTAFRAFDESGLRYDSKLTTEGFTWKQHGEYDLLVLEVTGDKDGAKFELHAKALRSPPSK